MNGQSPISVDLDRELYDQIVDLGLPATDAEEFVHEAVRFLIVIRSGRGSGTKATAKEELLAASFLRFMRTADPDLVSMVMHAMTLWRKKESAT